jgi:hypothetical protein
MDYFSTLKMEVAGTSEMFGPICQTTQSYIPEHCSPNSHCHEKHRSPKVQDSHLRLYSISLVILSSSGFCRRLVLHMCTTPQSSVQIHKVHVMNCHTVVKIMVWCLGAGVTACLRSADHTFLRWGSSVAE